MTTKDFVNIQGLQFLPSFAGEERVQLRQALEWATARIKQLENGPIVYGAVVRVIGDRVHVTLPGMQLELATPPRLELEEGNIVRVRPGDPPTIINRETSPSSIGTVVQVKQIIDAHRCEVSIENSARVVAFSGKAPRPSDRVVLDASGNAIVLNIGAGDTSRVVGEETGVEWDHIGGQDEAKRALREAIEVPVQHAELFKHFRMKRSAGVLISGPPGNGKTMLARAAATALARVHKKGNVSSAFIYVKGPDLLSKWVGESEANIRAVFAQARAHHDEHGYPAIIFVDEAESLLMTRGLGGVNGMERTIVPMFLAEMDGLFASTAFIILATNRPDTLDPAVVREGRIDRKIDVRRPTGSEIVAIAERRLEGKPLDVDAQELANRIQARLLDDRKYALYMVRKKHGDDARFSLAHVVSGAMVVGIVERATQQALRRAIADGGSRHAITLADIDAAVDEVFAEQKTIDHTDAMQELIGEFGKNVKSIDEVR